jgi:hypothetical protein
MSCRINTQSDPTINDSNHGLNTVAVNTTGTNNYAGLDTAFGISEQMLAFQRNLNRIKDAPTIEPAPIQLEKLLCPILNPMPGTIPEIKDHVEPVQMSDTKDLSPIISDTQGQIKKTIQPIPTFDTTQQVYSQTQPKYMLVKESDSYNWIYVLLLVAGLVGLLYYFLKNKKLSETVNSSDSVKKHLQKVMKLWK